MSVRLNNNNKQRNSKSDALQCEKDYKNCILAKELLESLIANYPLKKEALKGINDRLEFEF